MPQLARQRHDRAAAPAALAALAADAAWQRDAQLDGGALLGGRLGRLDVAVLLARRAERRAEVHFRPGGGGC